MVSLKLFTFVVLVYTANAGKDLDLGYKLVDCLQKAMILGIPSLGYKSHDPLIISRNLYWTLDFGFSSASFNVSNMIWYGLPQWNVTAKQLTEDHEPHVIFDYNIHWNKWLLTSLYKVDIDANSNPSALEGNMNITMDNTDWWGRVNFTKPGFNLTEQINDLTVYWTADQVGLSFTGLGDIEEIVSSTLGFTIKNFLNSGALGNKLGEFFHTRLNTNYFQQNEKIDAILEFCRTTPYPDGFKPKP
nr:uncharacterized protein LOC111512694 [Leptinotarsa decemlineata]